jgi:hypothetical protein
MAIDSVQIRRNNLQAVLLSRAECGSMDGGTHADIVLISYLVGIRVFGIFTALIGFRHVGVSFAVQASA